MSRLLTPDPAGLRQLSESVQAICGDFVSGCMARISLIYIAHGRRDSVSPGDADSISPALTLFLPGKCQLRVTAVTEARFPVLPQPTSFLSVFAVPYVAHWCTSQYSRPSVCSVASIFSYLVLSLKRKDSDERVNLVWPSLRTLAREY